MNPHMMFIDGGRRFQCVFCGAATDGKPKTQFMANVMKKIHTVAGPEMRVRNRKLFFLSYVVGTQKNHLNETVLLSTQNICLN